MYKIRALNQFLKDLKLLKKRSLKDFLLLEGVVELLSDKGHKGLEKNTGRIGFPETIRSTGSAI